MATIDEGTDLTTGLVNAKLLDVRYFSFYSSYSTDPSIVVAASISPGTDQDYFRFPLHSGDQVAAILPGSAASFGLYLYDSTGSFVTSAAGNVTIGYAAPLTGSYVLGVQNNAGTATSYGLSITVAAASLSLEGGAGAQSLDGWLGSDTLTGFAAANPGADTGADTLRGLADNDLLQGGGGNDLLVGGSDHDTVQGGAGADTLLGDNEIAFGVLIGAGSDRLQGGLGADLLIGGGGNDTLVGGAGADTLTGDALPDDAAFLLTDLFGSGVIDVLSGGSGNDLLFGAGWDRLYGGEGNDRFVTRVDPLSLVQVDGGDGTDRIEIILASDGIVTLRQNAPADFSLQLGTYEVLHANGVENVWLAAGTGNDSLVLAGGADSVIAGAGADTVLGGAGNDTLDGGADIAPAGGGRDLLYGGDGSDLLSVGGLFSRAFGDAGADTLIAYVGAGDTAAGFGAGPIGGAELRGGLGNDRLRDAGTNSYLAGGAGADTVEEFGTGAVIDGGGGNDLIRLGVVENNAYFGATGAIVEAGLGDDRIVVLGGTHQIAGGDGTDTLVLDFTRGTGSVRMTDLGGGSGRSVQDAASLDWDEIELLQVLGGGGNDTLVGGAGADTLNGGIGADRLVGGAGNDLFRLELSGAQGDTIAGFLGNGAAAGDRIQFVGFGTTGTSVVANGGGLFTVTGNLGSAQITIVFAAGTLDPTDYAFV